MIVHSIHLVQFKTWSPTMMIAAVINNFVSSWTCSPDEDTCWLSVPCDLRRLVVSSSEHTARHPSHWLDSLRPPADQSVLQVSESGNKKVLTEWSSYRYLFSTGLGSSLIWSSYYGSLSSASSVFFRPGSASGLHYYQAIRVIISTSGTYTFTSVSSIDTYGYLYNTPVDLSYPWQNMITYDDDSGGGNQFLLSAYLSSGSTYVLIVTTFTSNIVGSFSIRVSGPAMVGLTSFTPVTSRPIRTTSECIWQKIEQGFSLILSISRIHSKPSPFNLSCFFQHLLVFFGTAIMATDWEYQRS